MTDEPLVLTVDDLPANVRLLDAVLSPRGYRVLGAGSGPEALAATRSAAVCARTRLPPSCPWS